MPSRNTPSGYCYNYFDIIRQDLTDNLITTLVVDGNNDMLRAQAKAEYVTF